MRNDVWHFVATKIIIILNENIFSEFAFPAMNDFSFLFLWKRTEHTQKSINGEINVYDLFLL